MTVATLQRVGAAPPARIVHLGLGSFFRAHQAVYTDDAPDGEEWGIAAFSGRSVELAQRLTAQAGVYTLVVRGPAVDDFRTVSSIVAAYSGADHEQWLRCFRSTALSCVTLTITEYGYRTRADGSLDAEADDIAADIDALRADLGSAVVTAPARLVAGLAARRALDCGPLTVLSCDNITSNGVVAARSIAEFAERIDPSLPRWIEQTVSFPSTMVDRITPRPTPELSAQVSHATGKRDDCPVVTEPFSEWVIAGDFPAGRPAWSDAGATFATDIVPHELRKLRLLNGAHSLLAYCGLAFGLETVNAAIADDRCRALVRTWWIEASPGIGLPEQEMADYCERLLDRWANPRIAHRLTQIAADGSQKLPVRVLPVLRMQRAAGLLPTATITILAAWIGYLRQFGADARDAELMALLPLLDGTSRSVVRAVLSRLSGADAQLLADEDLLGALADALPN